MLSGKKVIVILGDTGRVLLNFFNETAVAVLTKISEDDEWKKLARTLEIEQQQRREKVRERKGNNKRKRMEERIARTSKASRCFTKHRGFGVNIRTL